MHIKQKAVRALVALAGMAAAMAVSQLVAPTAAQAYCAGENNERVLYLVVNGNPMAREVATTNTCNGNNTYQGDIYNMETGWTVVALVKNGTTWSRFYGGDTWGDQTHYQLGDTNMHVNLVLCVTKDDNWTCGNNTASVNSTGGPDTSKFEVNEGF